MTFYHGGGHVFGKGDNVLTPTSGRYSSESSHDSRGEVILLGGLIEKLGIEIIYDDQVEKVLGLYQ